MNRQTIDIQAKGWMVKDVLARWSRTQDWYSRQVNGSESAQIRLDDMIHGLPDLSGGDVVSINPDAKFVSVSDAVRISNESICDGVYISIFHLKGSFCLGLTANTDDDDEIVIGKSPMIKGFKTEIAALNELRKAGAISVKVYLPF